jgi:integrase/recombinase XerD
MTLDTPQSRDLIAGDTPLARHPVTLYLGGLRSDQSRRTMTHALQVLAFLLMGRNTDLFLVPWHTLRVQHTTLLATRLSQRYAPATARQRLAALRGMLKACWRLDLIDEASYRKAIDLTPIRGDSTAHGRALELPELGALLRACKVDTSITGARDYALIALLYNTGLRRSEIVALDWEDIDERGVVTVRQGKGRKARTVYLSRDVSDAIQHWRQAIGMNAGAIFRAISKSGRVLDRRLTDQAIWYILDRRATQAGIAAVRPHDMRRTTISTLLDQGIDLATVQKIAGHASPTTTARYDRRDERAKRAAGEGMGLPYE